MQAQPHVPRLQLQVSLATVVVELTWLPSACIGMQSAVTARRKGIFRVFAEPRPGKDYRTGHR